MTQSSQGAFRDAIASVPGFVYQNGLRLTALSLVWFVASLPLVTIGPATLGAYVAIQDLRSDRNRTNLDRIFAIVRQNGLSSMVFSGVPVAFGIVAAVYGSAALEQSSLVGEVVALVALYLALYVALVLIPTYTALARGTDPIDALRFGHRWLVKHPTAALALGLLTLVVLLVTALLTVGFILLFAGTAFSLQVAVVETVNDCSARTSSPTPAIH